MRNLIGDKVKNGVMELYFKYRIAPALSATSDNDCVKSVQF
jgi:hypothetical protein